MGRTTAALLALPALFTLVLVTAAATAGCKRGPVLDMRGSGDGGVVAVASAIDDAIVGTMVDVHPRSREDGAHADGSERAALDQRWGRWAGTRVSVPHCHGTAKDVLQDAARCAYPCSHDRECRGGDRCALAFELSSSGEVEAEPTELTVCTASPAAKDAGAKANAGPVVAAPPSLFGAPHLPSGGCARGFASVPSAGPLCYRSCGSDADCPEDASCRAPKQGGRGGRSGAAKLCVAH